MATLPTCTPEAFIVPCGQPLKEMTIQYSGTCPPDQIKLKYGPASIFPTGAISQTLNPPFTPGEITVPNVDICGDIKVELIGVCDGIDGPVRDRTYQATSQVAIVTPGACDTATGRRCFTITRAGTGTLQPTLRFALVTTGSVVWDAAGAVNTFTWAHATPPANLGNGLYSNIGQSSVECPSPGGGTADGTGARFDITVSGGTVTNVVLVTGQGGENYSPGDKIIINGTVLGGTATSNPLIITVGTITCTRACCDNAWVTTKIWQQGNSSNEAADSANDITAITSPGQSINLIAELPANIVIGSTPVTICTQVIAYNTRKCVTTLNSNLVVLESNNVDIDDEIVPCSTCWAEIKSKQGSTDLTCDTNLATTGFTP